MSFPFGNGGSRGESDEPLEVSRDGVFTESRWLGGQEVIVHYDDLPDCDIATVEGIRCTTALRTLIDVAEDVAPSDLGRMVQDCLTRGLFTVDDAWLRLRQPDMDARVGAGLLRRALPR